MRNQLRAGVYLSYLNLLLGSVIPLFYTPIMLRILGPGEYGLYSLANSLVGYLSLLDFGFGTTIIRYGTISKAQGDASRLERIYGLFLLVYTCLSGLILTGGFFLSGQVEWFFSHSLSAAEQDRLRVLILLLSLNLAVSFPFSVFHSMLLLHERFLFRRILDILATLCLPLGNLAVLYLGFGTPGMAAVALAVQLLSGFAGLVYCGKRLSLRPRFTGVPLPLFREMLCFSAFAFLASLVDMLFWSTDKVIIGIRIGSTAVAVYNIGCTFHTLVVNLSTSISGVLTPKITAMVAQNAPKQQWSALFIRVGRLQYYLIALLVTGFLVFGKPFIRLWAGAGYADAFWVSLLTLLPMGIPLIQNTGLAFLTALNKHRFRSLVYLLIALGNAVSTWLIVPRLGIIGAAVCTCAAYLLGQGLIMNRYYHKVIGLDIPAFWGSILSISPVPVGLAVLGIFLTGYLPLDSWPAFLSGVAVYTGIYGLLTYRFAMNPYEKSILRDLFRRICGLIHIGG